MKPEQTKPQKIVVFTKNWLGDVIFEEPFIRGLRRRFPTASITCITAERCRDILEAHPAVDEVWTCDDRTKDRGFFKRLNMYRRLRAAGFTHGFLLHRSFSRALLFYCARIPFRCGYATKMRRCLLTHAFSEPQQAMHRVDYLLQLLRESELFVDSGDATEYRFYFTDEDTRVVETLLQTHGIKPGSFVCFNPGANWPVKRWAPHKFAILADLLDEAYQLMIVITGSKQDESLAAQILAKTESRRIISLCGQTSIRGLGAVFASARCVVTADSGPLHIAAGVGTPSIALFGPTDPVETGPRGIGRSFVLQKTPAECRTPCFDDTCRDYRCMDVLEPEDVLSCIKEESVL